MERKIKVLFFIESLAGGGAEKVLHTIVKHIDKSKFDITVATVAAGGVYEKPISKSVRYEPIIKTRNRFLYKLLYHLIYFYLPLRVVYALFLPKGNDIEVAFCEGFATKLLAHSSNKNRIAWVHTDMLLNPWTQNIVYPSVKKERDTYLKYSKVVCVSDTVKKSVETKFGVEAATIYNPIDNAEIIRKSKEEVPLPEKRKLRMVTLGRLVEQKGYDRLLKVAKRLIDEKCDFELWILGEGPEKEKLTQDIERNKLNNHIRMYGFIPNPYPYIAASDIFVCSSRCEGFSTAATEAVILGLPVVTTLCSGMRELLGDNQYGIIVENEEMTLFEPLKKIITDSDYLSVLTRKVRGRGHDFGISSLIKPVERILQ